MVALKTRNVLLQAIFVLVLALTVGAFLATTATNMAEQGITSGFSFLGRATDWDMGFTVLPFSIRDPYWWTLLLGFINTVVVGYIAITLATVIGIGLAVMRISGNPVLNAVALAYVDVIRNIPAILQVLAWYAVFSSLPAPRQALRIGGGIFLSARGLYMPTVNVSGGAQAAVPVIALAAIGILLWIAFGKRFTFTPFRNKAIHALAILAIALALVAVVFAACRIPGTPLMSYPALQGFNFTGGMTIPPELITILVATTVYGSAYAAEIVRGGFLSVDRGKIEAARALGMKGWLIFSRIQMPLTVRNVLPMMTNLSVWLIKATTLGIAIGFSDFFMVVVSSINQSGQTIEFILILAAGFWLLNGTLAWAMNHVNDRIRLKH